ncbi:HEAT repeat domain-containing protein, partial [bacterium]|nr:HEAT repeat domain-containing protein [bacterium]
RACAAWVLAQRGEDAPLAALMESAKSREWAVRVAVATLLGEGKLDGAVPVLASLTKDPKENVRRAAVFSLGRSEDSHAGAALVLAALGQDADPAVRRLYATAFTDALGQATLDREQWKPSRTLLVVALEHDFPDATLEERRAQAFSLARLGDRPALLRLATGALTTSELPQDSRRAAIEALARLGRHDATEQALEGAIRDPKVGDDAALALARIRGETFFESQWRALLAPAVPFR